MTADKDPEGTVEATLSFVVAQAKHHLKARRIWLFGSRARGTAQRLSDIDIAIEAEFSDHPAWGTLVAQVEEEAPTLLCIDLVDIHSCAPNLRTQVLQEGVLLYER